MDAERIATIRRNAWLGNKTSPLHVVELCDALEVAQAENEDWKIAWTEEMVERGAFQAENTRLREEWCRCDDYDRVIAENGRLERLLTDFANTGDARIESLEDERDRLASQVTAYHEALGLARSMILSGESMSTGVEAVFDAALSLSPTEEPPT